MNDERLVRLLSLEETMALDLIRQEMTALGHPIEDASDVEVAAAALTLLRLFSNPEHYHLGGELFHEMQEAV